MQPKWRTKLSLTKNGRKLQIGKTAGNIPYLRMNVPGLGKNEQNKFTEVKEIQKVSICEPPGKPIQKVAADRAVSVDKGPNTKCLSARMKGVKRGLIEGLMGQERGDLYVV